MEAKLELGVKKRLCLEEGVLAAIDLGSHHMVSGRDVQE